MTALARALAAATALLGAGSILTVSLPAVSSAAATTTLCQSQTLPVAGGAYMVQNNEWGSSAPECITTDGNPDFTVAKSAIANFPGGYPSIYKGCHWGACTPGSGFPIQVSDIRAGDVTTSWRTSQPGGSSDYNAAYDIWLNQAPTTSGQPDGAELMIWLNHHGRVRPFGSRVASNVTLGGRRYDVWSGNQGWNTVSYAMTGGITSVRHLDLKALLANAVRRGYIHTSWYLIDVEAGFELWHGGRGLATKWFSVKVGGGGTWSQYAAPVTGLRVTGKYASLSASWHAGRGATGYQVTVTTHKGAVTVASATVTGRSYHLGHLKESTGYAVHVLPVPAAPGRNPTTAHVTTK